MELTATTTVAEPAEEVYGLWSDLERLPDFMAHLDEVRVTGPRTTHWRASAPFGEFRAAKPDRRRSVR
ncbi:SRPBCC family protein [Streptomyces sp. NPDC058291]|uniref:SRPBCC family protein n=1 Tax=Streptomyces sp. NPDC058291 TaxID=3346427 RepID=UPI0036E9F80C